MKLYIATTKTDLSTNRIEKLVPKLVELGIDYELVYGEITDKGYDGLYMTAKEIITKNIDNEFVIFAEDDLTFTEAFTLKKLHGFISKSQKLGLDVLATGAWQSHSEQLSKYKGLLTVTGFRGTQLTVIFKQAYERLLLAPSYNHFEDTISTIQPKLAIGLTFPFLSSQDTEGASIITGKNNNIQFSKNENLITLKLSANG